MSIVSLRVPSPEEEERTKRFQVHKNYLGGIDLYLTDRYGWGAADRLSAILDQQRTLSGYRKIQRSRPAEPAQLRRFLTLSWASEAQLRVHQGVEASILPYANAWAPVHAYYAVYMASVAWLSAQGHPDATNHRAVLSSISRQVSERKVFPLPWVCPCLWLPRHRRDPSGSGFRLAPTPGPGLSCSRIHLLTPSGPASARCSKQPGSGTSLAATRSGASRTAAKSLASLRSARLPRGSHLRRSSTSFGDCECAPTTKTLSYSWDRASASRGTDEFYESLSAVTEATCMLFENLIVQRTGPDGYRNAIRRFREGGGPLAEAVVGRRAELLVGS